jgi:crotonobetainyl-CoA:carnitine CoA-transferase CaiB-like acyl-CoA transferase
MDLTIQAVSGLIAATGSPEGPPVKAGPAVVDLISGIHLYAATLTALFERERTGQGRLVEVAMQEAAYATLTSQLDAYFETGEAPPRTGNASHVPLNETHQAERAKLPKSHGRYDWRDKCGTAGRPPIAQRPSSPRLSRRGTVYADPEKIKYPAEPRLPHCSTP